MRVVLASWLVRSPDKLGSMEANVASNLAINDALSDNLPLGWSRQERHPDGGRGRVESCRRLDGGEFCPKPVSCLLVSRGAQQ